MAGLKSAGVKTANAVSSPDCNNECKSNYRMVNAPHWHVAADLQRGRPNTHSCNHKRQYNGRMSHRCHMNLPRQALQKGRLAQGTRLVSHSCAYVWVRDLKPGGQRTRLLVACAISFPGIKGRPRESSNVSLPVHREGG